MSIRFESTMATAICVYVKEVGDFGLMSVFIDPTGAALAQSKKA